jgi:hypothetical protein
MVANEREFDLVTSGLLCRCMNCRIGTGEVRCGNARHQPRLSLIRAVAGSTQLAFGPMDGDMALT